MNWASVESRVFTAAAYVPEQRLLYLKFQSGYIYCYFDFPPEEHEAFLAAESKGEYFAHKIRDRFRYEQVYRSFAGR